MPVGSIVSLSPGGRRQPNVRLLRASRGRALHQRTGFSFAKTGLGLGGTGTGVYDALLASLYLAHMADALQAATGATKLFLEFSNISIDNITFKMFYRGTTTFLITASVLATSKQIFGDPISCGLHMGAGIKDDVLNSYCWMYSSFSIPSSFRGSCIKKSPDPTALYNTYYQWVPIFLSMNAILFCLPRIIWLMMEGGLMKFLTAGTTSKVVEDPSKKRAVLLDEFKNQLHNNYNVYAVKFFVCEQLNTLALIFSWFITDRFLKGQFITYGPDVYSYYLLPEEEREQFAKNPMCEVFPRLAACNFMRFGTAGRQETQNAICVLSLNMINDKVFLAMWHWYALLSLCMAHRLFLRLVQTVCPRIRFHILIRVIHKYLDSKARIHHVEKHIMKCGIGDWLVLCQMCKNMNKRFFSEFLTALVESEFPNPEGIEDVEEAELGNNFETARKRKMSTLSEHSELVDLSYANDRN